MSAAGVPIVPGSAGVVADEAAARSEATRIKYPVILKASAGGGGRGMRVVRAEEELAGAFATASNEAQQAFGVPDLYIEKFIERPRHIEFQKCWGTSTGTSCISASANAAFSAATRN